MSDTPKIDKIIEDHCRSYTYKYYGFFATHYHKGIKCWVVGAVNLENGQTTERHYNEKGYANGEHAKHEAQKYWDELKYGLIRPPTDEERATDEALLECWNEAARRARASLEQRFLN